MIVTEVVPQSAESADVATDDGREWLRARYARSEPAYVRLNMITSLTGAASGPDGTSETLTNRVDRRILGVIREDADVVLVGAQSVRAEGYVVPRRARLAILTTSGDLHGHRLTLEGSAAEQVVLLTPAARRDDLARAAEERGVTVIGVPGDAPLAPVDVLEALRDHGFARIVCEGGPTLASQFAAAGLIDEYCVTVAPAIEPAERPFVRVDAASRPLTDVAGMLVDAEGFSYLRLRPRA